MIKEERFSHHEPCPRCRSRDNLGVWDDGHKWCFGCKYYVPSPENINNLKHKLGDKVDLLHEDHLFDSSNYTYRIPDVPKAWLTKYGITDGDIHQYRIMWNHKTDSLVFPVVNQGRIVLTNERYFGKNPSAPKYQTYGHKNLHNQFFGNAKNSHNLVFVEDFISAIKCARFVCACPLLGSSINDNSFKYALRNYEKIRVWLDCDKAVVSIEQASRLSQFLPNSGSIVTPLDPKEYSNNELIKILKDHTIM